MNNIDFTKLKTASYNRKSSEAEDKQMLSIQSQIDEANRIAQYHHLKPFVELFKESKSAKTGGVRPEFSRMMSRIKKGEIDAIVCWKADRLARNMQEGGEIIDLLSSGILKAIITHDKVFYPWDNVLILAIEFGMGKQFVKELSINVKRGQTKKASMGTPHGVASLGFLNDKTEEKGNRKWLVDEKRIWKIKKLFEMFLTGTYSAGKLYKYAIDELKLTTFKRKHSGGNLIVNSRIYEILKDPIYSGFFLYGGEKYELDKNLPRLITEAEHTRVKEILSRKNIPKSQHHEAVYSGFIKSDEGNFMGQDVKFQLICDCKNKFSYLSRTHCPKCGVEIDKMENPKYLKYTHYYNVKKKKTKQSYRYLAEDVVTDNLSDFIENNLNFSNDLINWSRNYIHELKDKETSEKILISRDKEIRKQDYELKKSKLRALLRDGKINDDEYDTDLEILGKEYSDTIDGGKSTDWYTEMIEITDVLEVIMDIFKNGSYQAKRVIFSKLGSNLTWNEKILSIHNKKSVNKLVEGIKLIKSNYPEFSPKLSFTEQGLNEKIEPLSPIFSTMLLRQGSNLRPIA